MDELTLELVLKQPSHKTRTEDNGRGMLSWNPFCMQASDRANSANHLCFGILILIFLGGRSAPLGGRDCSETAALWNALLYICSTWCGTPFFRPLYKPLKNNSLTNQQL